MCSQRWPSCTGWWEELRQDELDYFDPDYEVLITIRAVKPTAGSARLACPGSLDQRVPQACALLLAEAILLVSPGVRLTPLAVASFSTYEI